MRKIFILFVLSSVLLGCRKEPHVSVLVTRLNPVTVDGRSYEFMQFQPDNHADLFNLIVWTPEDVAEASMVSSLEKISQLSYRVLWLQAFPTAGIPGDSLDTLLHRACQLSPPAEKNGLMLLDVPQPYCPGLFDSLFQAVLWVGDLNILECFSSERDSAVHSPNLALMVASKEPISITPAVRSWIRSPENFVWLATDRTPESLIVSDMEPILRRKAQLFFDRHLKGKR